MPRPETECVFNERNAYTTKWLNACTVATASSRPKPGHVMRG